MDILQSIESVKLFESDASKCGFYIHLLFYFLIQRVGKRCISSWSCRTRPEIESDNTRASIRFTQITPTPADQTTASRLVLGWTLPGKIKLFNAEVGGGVKNLKRTKKKLRCACRNTYLVVEVFSLKLQGDECWRRRVWGGGGGGLSLGGRLHRPAARSDRNV